ncbi:MAG TPA: peptide ABC transporter substrate-binding protein [Symbiobacteriaceae bacterium]|nr:peptide ABC transporter substrate-binding protein [Symbiobacteriaceae bacterium]
MQKNSVVRGLAAIMALSVLAGCGGAKKAAPAAGEKVIRYNAGSDFRSLDPQLMSDNVSGNAATQLFEGMVRMTEKGAQPGMAEKWEVSEGGKKYTFHLRKDAKWSNGDPVTADDFAFAWTRALDPVLASEYAYQLYYIKGGEAFNTGKGKAEDLGIKVVDANTLEVTLDAPTPYFLELTAFSTYQPVNKKVVTANKDWAAKAETFVSNGPFKLQSWEPKKQATFVKNESYWNQAAVKTSKLVFLMVEEQSTALQLFESGQVDLIESPPSAEMDRLKKENKLKFSPAFSTYYYGFNVTKAPFNDVRVRKALALAVDRKAIVENVTKAGQTPAAGMVPFGSKDETGKDFRDSSGNLLSTNVDEAKKLLAEAGYPNGQGFPVVELIYNTSEGHKAIAEAVIEMWKKNLGITTIRATNMEFKVMLDKKQKLDYQLGRAGWNGDYLDPMTFLDLWTSTSGNNDTGWKNAEYDALIKQAKSTDDQKVRMEAMRKAEALLMKEQPNIPVYFYTNPYLQADKVTNIYRNASGNVDFTYAEVK